MQRNWKLYHKGRKAWERRAVEADSPSGRKVLKQSGTAAFPWCVKDDIALTDGWIEVHFCPLAGREDQAGGLVWRWKDGDNYYVARANALENNVSLYQTTSGSRSTIEYRDAPVAKDAWHTLRVDFKGDAIRVSLDGKNCASFPGTAVSRTWRPRGRIHGTCSRRCAATRSALSSKASICRKQ